jgi:hypothetical protein
MTAARAELLGVRESAAVAEAERRMADDALLLRSGFFGQWLFRFWFLRLHRAPFVGPQKAKRTN